MMNRLRDIYKKSGDIKYALLFALVVSPLPLGIGLWLALVNSPVEDRREAWLNENGDEILCVVAGYLPVPISVEGPYPHWSNSLHIKLKRALSLPLHEDAQLEYGKDFTVGYDGVQSGKILLDAKKMVLIVDVEFPPSYSWQKTRGTFPLKYGR